MHALVEKKGKAKDEFYGKLIMDLGNEVRSSVEQGTAVMEKLVEKLGNAKGKVECKKLKNELKEARFSNTFLRMQNEQVKRDLYWTRVRAHEFYQEMIRRGFVFEERPNEAINVPIKDEKMVEDKDLEEDEFEEEEDPQEEEDDMEVDIEEDENEPELTYPYEGMDPLNTPSLASESEPEDAIEVENPIDHEDETVPASVYEVGELSTSPFLRENSDGLLLSLMRRDINSLVGHMASLSRRLCGHETMHALVEKKGKAKDEFYGKLIMDLGNE
nr:hypothetical protein [Tanacetum cinerariifolium]